MVERVLKNKFINAMFWMYLASGIISFGTLIYHIILGRYLNKPDFGEIESAISLFYIFLVPLMAISSVFIKMTSAYNAHGQTEKIRDLIKTVNSILLKIGLVSFFIFLLLSPIISNYLKFSSISTAILISLSFFVSIFVIVQRSVLQGVKDFKSFTFVNFTEAVIKSAGAGILIYFGFEVSGAIGALILGSIGAYFVADYFLKKYKGGKIVSFSYRRYFWFVFPFFIATLSLTSFYTTDIVIVRNLYSTETSGDYSALALMGKILFYAISPIALVMFPFISAKHAKGEPHTKIFLLSFFLTLMGSLFLVFMYYLMPEIFLSIFGPKYLQVASHMWIFGVFMTLYALINLMVSYFLSINKTSVSYLVLIFAIFQIILLYLFQFGIKSVMYANILTSFILLILLIAYYIKLNYFNKKNVNKKEETN